MYRYMCLVVVLVLLLAGCSTNDNNQNNDKAKEKEESIIDDNEVNYNKNENGTTDNPDKKEKTVDEKIEEMIDGMTLEEKIGQMFMIDADSLNNAPVTVLDDFGREVMKKYNLGGVIFFKNNINTIPQTEKLISDIQETSSIPLFISVDEEGGLVSRIAKNPNMHATVLPNNKVIGDTGNTENAYKIGQILGREISSLGFNMDFAPVADINTNPDNTVIGVRSYGSDEQLVGDMVYNCVKGLQDENVSAVVKHFPGHGDTTNDTHLGSVVTNHNIERLREIEFVPFKKGIEADVDGVMIAHIKAPQIDETNTEASLSKKIVTDILRNELGYDGLAITDALNMGAIVNEYGTKEACIKAVEAGIDILLMPVPFEEGYSGVLESVISKTISEERIDESVRRILEVKFKRDLFNQDNTKNAEEILGSKENLDLLESIKK
ncbi:glycoside hydrolase family 3 protein [Vallitalea guaymasensis]|uniref:beta-N-acetylhexosaminidase n=1 Tax=Vallitalea guaymasensis TaxID=1185412 RepID=A0A8J8SDM9_9FIRM|nr:glycoside hydrolase family 3 protein [Vallitalea guaymasensis]QUH30982.1 glycoside hydrolase [Vallitalea guaymasensis]